MSVPNSVRRIVMTAGIVASAVGCGSNPPPPTEPPAPTASAPVANAPPKALLPIEALFRKLRSPSPTAQGAAVDELATAAATDPEVVPGLVVAVDETTNRGAGAVFPNQVNSIREAAVVGLLKSGPAGERAFAEQALPKLIAGLSDPDPAVREHTAVALSRAGRRAEPAVPALWPLAEDESVNVRGAAYRALIAIEIEPASTLPVAELLAHSEPAVRAHAAEMLRRFQPLPDAAVPLLADALEDDDPFVRGAAATALIPFGPKAAPAVPRLIEAVQKIQLADLQKPEPIELAPVNALAAVGEPAVGPTTKLLKEKEPLIRYLATYTLGEIGPAAKSALPELEKLLRDTSGEVALEAARAVAVVGGDSAPTTELMKFALGHMEPATRLYALQTIVRMGDAGRGLAPLALPLIDDPTPEVRRAALTYVGTLDGKTAKPVIGKVADMLQSDDESTRLETARVLGELGSAAGPAADALGRTAANDNAPPVRTAALFALSDLGTAGKGGLPGLITLAKNANADHADRAKAITALPRIGPSDKPAFEAVMATSTDKSAIVREAAATALGRFPKPSAPTVGRLAELAKSDPSPATRSAALESIARLGPKAAAARPTVESLAGDRSGNVSVWAKVGVARIDEKPDAALAAIRAGLASASPGEQQAAAEAMPLLGEPAEADVTAVARLLTDESPYMRRIAADVLGRLGRAARPAVPRLLKLMANDTDGEVRTAAAKALGSTDDVSTEVIVALRAVVDTDPTAARAARVSLRQLGK